MHWSILEKVHCLVLQTAAVTSTLVLVYHWAVIAGSDTTSLFPDDYLKHAAIAPVILLDVWFSKVPFASYHLQVSAGSRLTCVTNQHTALQQLLTCTSCTSSTQ